MQNYLTSDDAFNAFKAKAEADKKAAQNHKPTSYAPREYEQIAWCGLSQNETHIVRIVGAPPASMTPGYKGNVTDAREFFFSKIMDDNGKVIQLKLPVHADDMAHEHIMWRIINRVKEVKWEKGTDGSSKKTPIHVGQPWYDTVLHGGYPVTNQNYTWSRGWSGQQVVVMNVIDREDNWCKENKHTKLLSKNVNVVKRDDGTESVFADTGVPSYGFLTKLQDLNSKYGSWEKYDVAIERTGDMTNPYNVRNATAFASSPDLITELGGKETFVSNERTLTEEELSFERYDLEKCFPITSYGKIKRSLGKTIAAIDLSLGTKFTEELDSLVAIEEKEFAEKAAQTAEAAQTEVPPVIDTTPVHESVPVRRTSAPTEKYAMLKGYEKLPADQKALIVDVVTNANGEVTDIKYSSDAAPTVGCPECNIPSPNNWLVCPCCGVDFQVE